MAQDIYIKFKGDATNLQATVNRVNQSLQGLESRSLAASRSIDRTETSSRRLGDTMRSLTGVVAGFVGALGVNELLQFGDTVQNIQNRLRLIDPALGSVAQNFERVKNIANSTFQPLENVADLFQKVARSADQYNLSAGDVGTVTTTFTNLLRLAGADAGTAAGAITQFAQALGSGVLRGDELNTVIEATAGEILPILAKELGVSTGEVRKLAEEGKITGDVLVRALGNAADDVGARVGAMNVTIGGAITTLKNNFLDLGTSVAPVFSVIAEGILLLANNLERMAVYVATAAAVFVGYKVALAAAAVATGGLSAALLVLRGALIRTGIGALVVLLGEAVYQTMQWAESVGGISAAFSIVKRYATEVLDRIKRGFYLLTEEVWYVGESIRIGFGQAFAFVIRQFADFSQTMINGWNSIRQAFALEPIEGTAWGSEWADELETSLENAQVNLDDYRQSLNSSWSDLFDPIVVETAGKGLGSLRGYFSDMGDAANAAVTPVKKLTDETQKLLDTFRKLPGETESVRLAIDAFNEMNPLEGLEREYAATLDGLQILRDQDKINEAEYLNTKAKLHQNYAKQVADIQRQSAVDSMRLSGVTNQGILQVYEQTYASMQQSQQGGISGMIGFTDAMATVFGQLGQQSEKAFNAAKAFNIASAIMNTALAATKAFAQGGILGFVTAAAVIAAGMAQVSAIRSQTYSGRALGGPVMGSQSYIVGENGPEIFTPYTSGNITRNDQIGGGQPVEITFNINAIDSQGIDQVLVARQSVIRQLISDAMLEAGQRSRF